MMVRSATGKDSAGFSSRQKSLAHSLHVTQIEEPKLEDAEKPQKEKKPTKAQRLADTCGPYVR
jgi:hypothetical protein